MSVIFTSQIKIDENNQWYIELKDTVDGRVAICHSLEEYESSIEDFGSDYGGNIDEVNWSKDSNVPPLMLNEVRMQMAEYQARQSSDSSS